jgi:signal transduction histidine kinase
VELTAALDATRPLALGDERQLRRVLRNLVKNSCEAQPGGGRVTITTRRGDAPDTVAVEVADEGPGMDPATVARAFEPGFSTKGRGSGVGLTVSRRVVEQHGGSLDIETAPGRGTRVTVVLPALAEATA